MNQASEVISYFVENLNWTFIVICSFKALESADMTLNKFFSYLSELIRSVVVVVVFNSEITNRIFSKIKKVKSERIEA